MNRIQRKQVKLAKLSIKFARKIGNYPFSIPINKMIRSIKAYHRCNYKEFDYELFLDNEIDVFRNYID